MIKKLALFVGEPWDFEGPDGKNVMYGEVVYEISPKAVIFKAFNEQTFGKGKGCLFVCSTRYQGDILVHVDSKGNKKYEGTLGAGLLKNANYINKSYEDLEKESIYVLIGNFKYVE